MASELETYAKNRSIPVQNVKKCLDQVLETFPRANALQTLETYIHLQNLLFTPEMKFIQELWENYDHRENLPVWLSRLKVQSFDPSHSIS